MYGGFKCDTLMTLLQEGSMTKKIKTINLRISDDDHKELQEEGKGYSSLSDYVRTIIRRRHNQKPVINEMRRVEKTIMNKLDLFE